MKHKILALFDPEQDYAQQMGDFLRRKKDALWEIRVFTRTDELLAFAGTCSIEILLISEAVYGDYVKQLPAKLCLILNESGLIREEFTTHIDKYQPAEMVYREVLYHYMECDGETYRKIRGPNKGKMIGMYSPVRRCLQTTFALTFSQILAEKDRTLYISFEYYSGLAEWQECKRQDLSTFLYYLQNKQEDLGIHLQTAVWKTGNLDCILPMVNGENLLYISPDEWKKLLESLVNSGEYEYIILDLSESVQGLFEILRRCDRIYTIIREDRAAEQKMCRYEQLLLLQEYEDVKEKTAKCRLPIFRKLPESVNHYTRGELAEYIRGMLRTEEGAT